MKITIPKSALSDTLRTLASVTERHTVIRAAGHAVTFAAASPVCRLAIMPPTAYADEDGEATVPLKAFSAALSKARGCNTVCLKSTGHVLQLLAGGDLYQDASRKLERIRLAV